MQASEGGQLFKLCKLRSCNHAHQFKGTLGSNSPSSACSNQPRKSIDIHAAHLEALGVAHGQHSKVG